MVIKRLVDTHNPTMIFMQETMLDGDKAIEIISPLIKG
jgi:hypothetical protein